MDAKDTEFSEKFQDFGELVSNQAMLLNLKKKGFLNGFEILGDYQKDDIFGIGTCDSSFDYSGQLLKAVLDQLEAYYSRKNFPADYFDEDIKRREHKSVSSPEFVRDVLVKADFMSNLPVLRKVTDYDNIDSPIIHLAFNQGISQVDLSISYIDCDYVRTDSYYRLDGKFTYSGTWCLTHEVSEALIKIMTKLFDPSQFDNQLLSDEKALRSLR